MNDKKVIEMYLEVGSDNGNSEHDIIINGELIQQPNVMSKIRVLPLLDEVNPEYVSKNIHSNLITSINSPSVRPGTYYIGNYALGAGERIRNIAVGFDNSKLESDVIVVNTLSQIAGYAVKQAFLQGNDLKNIELQVKVDMTTALPVTQYSKKAADLFAEKFMKDKNKHNVTVHVGNINVNVYIVFEFVKVLPEAVPAVFALQHMKLITKPEDNISDVEKEHNERIKRLFADFNASFKSGETIDGNYFVKKRILHVGIGEGTTEYPLTKDIVFDPNFITGSNNGIGHAIDKALPEFKKEQGLLNYSRQKYSEVLRDKTHKYYNTAMDIVEGYIEEESEEILHNIKTEIERANNEIDVVMVYGGGSILMKEYLKEKIEFVCERANIKLFYVPEEFAVILESLGMYEFTKGKIFKKLKEKYYNEI